jgi:thiol:disulfide interchange protein
VIYFLDKYLYSKMPVKEVSDGGLKQELEGAGDKLVLVDFYATW